MFRQLKAMLTGGVPLRSPFSPRGNLQASTCDCLLGARGGSKACISASHQGWTRSALHLRQLASVERGHHDRASRLSDWMLDPVHVSRQQVLAECFFWGPTKRACREWQPSEASSGNDKV